MSEDIGAMSPQESQPEPDPHVETAYLLSSHENAVRLTEALKRDPRNRVRFKDIQSLRDEVGI